MPLSREQFQEAEKNNATSDDPKSADAGALGFDWFHALRGSAAGIVFLGMFCILALFVAAQVTSTLAALAVLPSWARLSGYFGLSLLTGVLLFTAIGLAWKYFRLRRNRQVTLADVLQLEQRREMQTNAQRALDEAVNELRGYLLEYRPDDRTQRSFLLGMGVCSQEIDSLNTARDRLLDVEQFAGNRPWFDDYVNNFQAVLDSTAKARVERFAKRAAVKTAISPNALLDTLIVTYLGFAMLTDLCGIYRVRLGGIGTAMLLAHLFFNAYVAGDLNDLEGGVGDTVQSLLHSSGELVSLALGKITAKGASAILNYALLSALARPPFASCVRCTRLKIKAVQGDCTIMGSLVWMGDGESRVPADGRLGGGRRQSVTSEHIWVLLIVSDQCLRAGGTGGTPQYCPGFTFSHF